MVEAIFTASILGNLQIKRGALPGFFPETPATSTEYYITLIIFLLYSN